MRDATVLEPADYWQLKARWETANVAIERATALMTQANQMAADAIAARDAYTAQINITYQAQIDPTRDLQMDDQTYSVVQMPAPTEASTGVLRALLERAVERPPEPTVQTS